MADSRFGGLEGTGGASPTETRLLIGDGVRLIIARLTDSRLLARRSLPPKSRPRPGEGTIGALDASRSSEGVVFGVSISANCCSAAVDSPRAIDERRVPRDCMLDRDLRPPIEPAVEPGERVGVVMSGVRATAMGAASVPLSQLDRSFRAAGDEPNDIVDPYDDRRSIGGGIGSVEASAKLIDCGESTTASTTLAGVRGDRPPPALVGVLSMIAAQSGATGVRGGDPAPRLPARASVGVSTRRGEGGTGFDVRDVGERKAGRSGGGTSDGCRES